MSKVTTRRVAKVLRDAGLHPVVTGDISLKQRYEAWVIGENGIALVINSSSDAVLADKDFRDKEKEMSSRVAKALEDADIPFELSPTPSQFFLNGYDYSVHE